MGPGPGERGGEIVFEGTPKQLVARVGSLTGDYLAGRRDIRGNDARAPRTVDTESMDQAWVGVRGASEHNLRSVDADFPLERMTCVTGVSGSGKSTLVQDVFYQAMRAAHGQPDETPGAHDRLLGAELVDDVVMVDQSAIGAGVAVAITVRDLPGVEAIGQRAVAGRAFEYPGCVGFEAGVGNGDQETLRRRG